jgi:hypothetical protein
MNTNEHGWVSPRDRLCGIVCWSRPELPAAIVKTRTQWMSRQDALSCEKLRLVVRIKTLKEIA